MTLIVADYDVMMSSERSLVTLIVADYDVMMSRER